MSSYVLVADVLGFSNIASNLSHDILSDRMNTWVGLVKDVGDETGIKYIQLASDTIFAQEEDSEDGVMRLFRFSKLLLERGIEKCFPIRGAITYGDVSWEKDMIYGKAVVKAHELEKALDWIGIACGKLPKIPWSWDLVCTYPAPKKKGIAEVIPAVIWNIPNEIELFDLSSDKGIMNGDDDKVRWENYTKPMNTIIFSKYIRNAKKVGYHPSEFDLSVPSHLNLTSQGEF